MTVEELLRYQFLLHPGIGPLDVAKMFFQSAYGPMHYIAHNSLTDPPLAGVVGEELIEEIDPRGVMVRVNLRPFILRGGILHDIELIAKLSGEVYSPCESLFGLWWDEAESFFAMKGWRYRKPLPPYHHSLVYKSLYKPAYIVVLRELLEKGDLWERQL